MRFYNAMFHKTYRAAFYMHVHARTYKGEIPRKDTYEVTK